MYYSLNLARYFSLDQVAYNRLVKLSQVKCKVDLLAKVYDLDLVLLLYFSLLLYLYSVLDHLSPHQGM